MLYTALWHCSDDDAWVTQHTTDLALNPYKATHINHPTSKWVRSDVHNFNYTLDLALELCYEYTRRYGKIHKCQCRLEWLRDHPPITFTVQDMANKHCATQNIPVGCTPVPLAMPEQFYSDDLLYSYRLYYIVEKSRLCTSKDTFNVQGRIDEWDLRSDIKI